MPGGIYRLALARAISIGGGAASYMALNIAVWDLTDSAVWVSAALLLTFGIQGILGPLGGLVADRFDRRKVMVWSDLGGAVCFLLMALVTHDAKLLIGAAFLSAVVETPFFPASSAAIPSLAPPEKLDRANAVLIASRNFGIFVGPLLGGALVGVFGAGWVFVVNALTFVVSAALVWSVRRPFQKERGEHENVGGLRVGFQFLFHDRVLMTISIAWIALTLGMGMAMVADLPYIGEFDVANPDAAYGILIALWGLGSVAGTVVGRWLRPGLEGAFMIVGTLMMCAGNLGAAVSPWFALAVVLIGASGLGDAFTVVAEESLRQRRTPDHIRSRVISASMAGWQVAFALSFALGGLAVNVLGPRGVYAFTGAMTGVAAVLLVPILGILRRERAAGGQAEPGPGD